MIVIRCGEAPVPPVLVEHARVECAEIPTRDEADRVLRELDPDRRLLVCGTDAALAALLTRFMRLERLDVEIAYVTAEAGAVTRAYGLPTGSAAARLGMSGTAREVPLVRDETGTAVVGEVTVTGPDGGPLTGEAYADDDRVFTGEIEALVVHPSPELPGVRATAGRRRGLLRRLEWFDARAVQLGTDAGVVTRDGVPGRRPVKRASFYRHADPWRLVSP
ncbi:hypothetical protein [Dietzia sp. 179-F 9C3 NHS]|uniref:hypothetical protein n=1 Tax=Dietzia sp. 179-F 9C3 NHS TaxID=3374295 RepID=UPI00387974CD